MLNRIAVPFLAMSLLALPALAADPSPKAPVASPAKVVAASPKPAATPSKSASTTKKHRRVARNHATVEKTTTSSPVTK